MNGKRWLIGCALLAGGSGVAMAAGEMDAQDLDGAQHISSVEGGRDNATVLAGDTLGGNRDDDGRGDDGATSSNPSSNGGANSREDAHAPLDGAASHPVHLGWQSLLPGSIQ